jgi:hypothetical protein
MRVMLLAWPGTAAVAASNRGWCGASTTRLSPCRPSAGLLTHPAASNLKQQQPPEQELLSRYLRAAGKGATLPCRAGHPP